MMEVGRPSHQPGNVFKYTSRPQGVAECEGSREGGRANTVVWEKKRISPGDSNMPASVPNLENHPFGDEKRKLPQTWHEEKFPLDGIVSSF